jgi:FAD/FMN-containing dehydrogenase
VALLVELAGEVDDELLTAVAAIASGGDGSGPPVVVGLDEADRRRLWALRERHTEVIGRLGVPVKLDVAVPAGRLGELVERAPGVAAGAAPGARTIVFGHAAEANCHVNVVLPDRQTGEDGPDPGAAEAVEDAVLGLVTSLGGTVSAEHGIGRAKVRHLGRTRDPASVDAMRAIKDALDPTGILNPGVVLPDRA